jgi:hypothetical protein
VAARRVFTNKPSPNGSWKSRISLIIPGPLFRTKRVLGLRSRQSSFKFQSSNAPRGLADAVSPWDNDFPVQFPRPRSLRSKWEAVASCNFPRHFPEGADAAARNVYATARSKGGRLGEGANVGPSRDRGERMPSSSSITAVRIRRLENIARVNMEVRSALVATVSKRLPISSRLRVLKWKFLIL